MNEADFKELEDHACPAAGACGGQFTANTMSMAFTALGISPTGMNDIPAMDPKKDEACIQIGKLIIELIKQDVRPSQIITKKSIENSIRAVATSGGSTNAVLHLLAIAHEMNIPLSIDDFDRLSAKTPLLGDLKPGGRFVATDLYQAGGIRLVMKRLLDAGLLHRDCLTVTTKTIAH